MANLTTSRREIDSRLCQTRLGLGYRTSTTGTGTRYCLNHLQLSTR
jgi:peptide methionine sulfoxide reductase MsrB